MVFLAPVLVIILVIVAASMRIVREYERGVVYTLGQYSGMKGPGLCLVIPVLQSMIIVDTRVRTQDIPPQDVISKDNVSVKVNAVVYYRVVEPSYAINNIEDFIFATSQLAQTTLRSILGRNELDEMLSHREKLNNEVQEIMDIQTEGWGIKVTNVEIKDIDLDENMRRVMARQAEADRERRAKIINAQGELQAAEQLDQAAEILARRPETMQLRYLSTLGQFTSAQHSTIVLPLPLDLLKGGVQAALAKKAG